MSKTACAFPGCPITGGLLVCRQCDEQICDHHSADTYTESEEIQGCQHHLPVQADECRCFAALTYTGLTRIEKAEVALMYLRIPTYCREHGMRSMEPRAIQMLTLCLRDIRIAGHPGRDYKTQSEWEIETR